MQTTDNRGTSDTTVEAFPGSPGDDPRTTELVELMLKDRRRPSTR